MLSSDSEDEIIPGVKKFGDMFAMVKREAWKLDSAPGSSSSSNKTSKEKVVLKKKKKVGGKKTKIPVKKDKPETPLEEEKKDDLDSSLSNETKHLLAELDKLTSSLPKATSPPSKPTTRGKGRKRGRGRPRKQPEEDLGPIVISSDEDKTDIKAILEGSMNGNDEDKVAEEVEDICFVHVRWNSEILRFNFPHGTKLSTLRNSVSTRVNVRSDDIVILNEASEEIPDDLPLETLKFGDILDAFVLTKEAPAPAPASRGKRSKTSKTLPVVQKTVVDPATIKLKVQGSGGYRERLEVEIKRTTHVKQLMDDFIAKFKLQGRTFKLIFDGDTVDPSETPESLDLDGGEMFDIILVK